jgi:hypothetical protein
VADGWAMWRWLTVSPEQMCGMTVSVPGPGRAAADEFVACGRHAAHPQGTAKKAQLSAFR